MSLSKVSACGTQIWFNTLRVVGLMLCLRSTIAVAQVIPSERASISQTVDGTRIEVEYARPRARGRTIYGTPIVSWGEVWTPGADQATSLEFSRDVSMGGKVVKRGKYSVWTVVRQDSAWTFVLDPMWDYYHTKHPDSTRFQIRFPVKTRSVPPVEMLTWRIDHMHTAGLTLTMEWGPIAFDVNVAITPTHPTPVTAEEAAPFVGTYAYVGTDTSRKPNAVSVTVERRNGNLFARFTPKLNDFLAEIMLVPFGENRFIQGTLMNGELFALYDDPQWTFTRVKGKAASFEVRFKTEQLMAKGSR